MQRNRLGKSDLYVSEIGFGSMSIPDDEQTATRMIHEALDSGVNFIDTADLYGRGRVEEVIGKALLGRRQDVIIATKVGNHWEDGKSGWFWDPSYDYIKSAVKESLRRLGTDYIDLYQLHGGTIEDNFEETIRAFEELREEGHIRWYGISSIRPNVIRRFVEHSNIVSVMMQYSILDRRPEECCLDFLKEHGVSAIVRGPVASGLLSDNLENKVKDTGYLEYSQAELLALVDKLRTLTSTQRNVAQLAIRYALSHSAVATVVPGASRLTQLHQNISAASVPPLTPNEVNQVKQWSKATAYQQHR